MKDKMKDKLMKVYDLMEKDIDHTNLFIPANLIVKVQMELGLKGMTDDELYELWFTVNNLTDELYEEYQGEEEYNIIRNNHISLLEIINSSKSFKLGILY